MTEEEAKTRWCPVARSPNDADIAANRLYCGDPDKACFCIASACMAWRWGSLLYDDNNKRRPSNDDSGYCGLAGKP